jgi:hypothetical protein
MDQNYILESSCRNLGQWTTQIVKRNVSIKQKKSCQLINNSPLVFSHLGIKRQFREELNALVSSVPIFEKLFIGDLNGHVGSTRVGFDRVYEGFGYRSRDQEEEGVLNFALVYDLIVVNTLLERASHSNL